MQKAEYLITIAQYFDLEEYTERRLQVRLASFIQLRHKGRVHTTAYANFRGPVLPYPPCKTPRVRELTTFGTALTCALFA